MELNMVIIEFSDNEISRRDTPKIRGYIASKFPEYIELHNHTQEGFKYQYPLIQYKTIGGRPYLIGIGKGADILMQIEPALSSLDIGGETQEIYQKSIKRRRSPFGVRNEFYQYRFVTPWMALNQKNYRLYSNLDNNGRIELLKKVLTGNLLSMSKAFGYHVDRQINLMIQAKPVLINFKDNKMLAFKGSFLCNFEIPDYLGVGKSVSRGLGTVVKDSNLVYK